MLFTQFLDFESLYRCLSTMWKSKTNNSLQAKKELSEEWSGTHGSEMEKECVGWGGEGAMQKLQEKMSTMLFQRHP